jgi:hypothetical protein
VTVAPLEQAVVGKAAAVVVAQVDPEGACASARGEAVDRSRATATESLHAVLPRRFDRRFTAGIGAGAGCAELAREGFWRGR